MNSILIVDDEQSVLDDILSIINWDDFGFENVLTAFDLRGAKRKIQIFCPCLIITDIKLEEENGLELISFAKKLNANCFVIILSAYDDFSYCQMALRDGAMDYMLKPIDKHLLEKNLQIVKKTLTEQEISNIASVNYGYNDNKTLFNEVLIYIKDNYNKKINVADLEKIFHLNYHTINKLFLDNIGRTMKNYVIMIRIETAMTLLKNSDLPFSSISCEVGYEDSFHFSKLFKKHTGFTPSEYKNNKGRRS